MMNEGVRHSPSSYRNWAQINNILKWGQLIADGYSYHSAEEQSEAKGVIHGITWAFDPHNQRNRPSVIRMIIEHGAHVVDQEEHDDDDEQAGEG